MDNVSVIVMLLFGIALIGIVSRRFGFPIPIVLVICGVIISLIPGLPIVSLRPDVVFLVFLPPLLYGAAWNTGWHEFKGQIRSISFAAIGLVLFTTAAVAITAMALIPGIEWPLAFLIGAI